MIENIKRINDVQSIFNNVNEYFNIIVHQLEVLLPIEFHSVDYHSDIYNILSTEYILLLESIDNGIYTLYIAPYSDYAFDHGVNSHYNRLSDNLKQFNTLDNIDIEMAVFKYSNFFDYNKLNENPLDKSVYKEIKKILLHENINFKLLSSDYDAFVRNYLNPWTKSFIRFVNSQYKKLSNLMLDSTPDDNYNDYKLNHQNHLENIRKNYSWYYDLNRLDTDSGEYEILNVATMYSKLGNNVAQYLYQELHKYMLEFAHSEQSSFYGDYPTIWEQLKADERHGDPPMNEYQLEICCSKWLNKLSIHELELLWVYACNGANNSNITIYDDNVENADFEGMIFRVILGELYSDAEKENQSYYDE